MVVDSATNKTKTAPTYKNINWYVNPTTTSAKFDPFPTYQLPFLPIPD
jgi:hypothetical protein